MTEPIDESKWKEFKKEVIDEWKKRYKDLPTNKLKYINANYFKKKIGIEKRYTFGRSILSILAAAQMYPLIKYLNKCNQENKTNAITNQYVPVKGLFKNKYASYTALEASIYSYLDEIDEIKDKVNYKNAFIQTVINLILCENSTSATPASATPASSNVVNTSQIELVSNEKYKRLLNGSNLSLVIESDKYKFEQFKSKNTTTFHLILVNAAKTGDKYAPFKEILEIICDNLNLLTIDINEVDDWGFSGFYILTWYLIEGKITLDMSSIIGKFLELGGNPFINNSIENFKQKIGQNYNRLIKIFPKNVYELLNGYPRLMTIINQSSSIFAMKNQKTNVERISVNIAELMRLDEEARKEFNESTEEISRLTETIAQQQEIIDRAIEKLPIQITEKEKLENILSSIEELQGQYQREKSKVISRISDLENFSIQTAEEIQKEIEELNRRRSEINAELTAKRAEGATKRGNLERLQSEKQIELQRITAEQQNILSRISTTNTEKNALEKLFDEQLKTLFGLEKKRNELKEALSKLESNKKVSNFQISDLERSIAEQERLSTEQTERIAALEGQIEELAKQYNITGSTAKNLETLLGELRSGLEGKNAEITRLKSNLNNLQQNRNRLNSEKQQFKKLNDALILRLKAITESQKTLQTENDRLQAAKIKIERELNELKIMKPTENTNRIRELKNAQRILELRISNIQKALAEKEDELNRYREFEKNIRIKLLKLLKKNTKSNNTGNELVNQITTLLTNKNAEIKRLTSITEGIPELKESQRRELEEKETQLSTLQGQIVKQERQISEQTEQLGKQGNYIKELLKMLEEHTEEYIIEKEEIISQIEGEYGVRMEQLISEFLEKQIELRRERMNQYLIRNTNKNRIDELEGELSVYKTKIENIINKNIRNSKEKAELQARLLELEKHNQELIEKQEELNTELQKISEKDKTKTQIIMTIKDALLEKEQLEKELEEVEDETENTVESFNLPKNIEKEILDRIHSLTETRNKEMKNLMSNRDELEKLISSLIEILPEGINTNTNKKIINGVKQYIDNLRKRQSTFMERISQLEGITNEQKRKIEEHTNRLRNLETRYQTEKNDIEQRIAALGIQIPEIQTLQGTLDKLESVKTEKENLKLKLQSNSNASSAQIASLESELQRLKTNKELSNTEITRLFGAIKFKTGKQQEKEKEIKRLRQAIQVEEESKRQLQEEFNTLSRNNPNRATEISGLRTRITELQTTSTIQGEEYERLVQEISNISGKQNLSSKTTAELRNILEGIRTSMTDINELERQLANKNRIIAEKNATIGEMLETPTDIESFAFNYFTKINQQNPKELFGKSEYIVHIQLMNKLFNINNIIKTKRVSALEEEIENKVYTFDLNAKVTSFLEASQYILRFETTPKKTTGIKINKTFIEFFNNYFENTNNVVIRDDFSNFLKSIYGQDKSTLITELISNFNTNIHHYNEWVDKYQNIKDYFNTHGFYNINSINYLKEYCYIVNNIENIKPIKIRDAYLLNNKSKIIEIYNIFANKYSNMLKLNQTNTEDNKLNFIKKQTNTNIKLSAIIYPPRKIQINTQRNLGGPAGPAGSTGQATGGAKKKPKRKIFKRKTTKKQLKNNYILH
jgi:chromosome segregation ATPase